MTPLRIAISGAAGRMGQRLVALGRADKDLEIVAAIEDEGHAKIGCDAGEIAGVGKIGVDITSSLERKVDILIDFSSPKAAEKIVEQCLSWTVPLVYAATGTTPEQNAMIREAATRLPILMSPSMSMTVNVAMKLCEKAAQTLKDKDVDVEIIEKHHRFKADSPSGTALKFGKIISDEMGLTKECFGREGIVGERPHEEIAYHAVRIGGNPGEHTILFGMLGETLEISVKAINRDCYVQGAFEAAKFLHGKAPGLYSMNDVLGL